MRLLVIRKGEEPFVSSLVLFHHTQPFQFHFSAATKQPYADTLPSQPSRSSYARSPGRSWRSAIRSPRLLFCWKSRVPIEPPLNAWDVARIRQLSNTGRSGIVSTEHHQGATPNFNAHGMRINSLPLSQIPQTLGIDKC